MSKKILCSIAGFCGALSLLAMPALAQTDDSADAYTPQYETYEDYYETIGKNAKAQDPSEPVILLEGAQIFGVEDRIYVTRLPVLMPNGKTLIWDLELLLDTAANGKVNKTSLAKNAKSPVSTSVFKPGRYYDPFRNCMVQIKAPATGNGGRLAYNVQTLASQPVSAASNCKTTNYYDVTFTTGKTAGHPQEAAIKRYQCTYEGTERAYGQVASAGSNGPNNFNAGELAYMTDVGGGHVTITGFNAQGSCNAGTAGVTLVPCEKDACLK